MENLELIRHLYDEGPTRPLEEVLGEDPGQRAAYDELVATRDLLTARPGVRPDPSVIDAVVGRAAARASASVRMDRSPLRLVRFLRPVSWAAAACLVAVVGFWVGRYSVDRSARLSEAAGPTYQDAQTAKSEKMEEAPATSLMERVAPIPEAGLQVGESIRPPARSAEGIAGEWSDEVAPSPAPALAAEKSVLPRTARVGDVSWEGVEDLFVIQSRVLSLEEALTGIEWDQAVPLGALQAGEGRPYEGAAAAGDSSSRRPPR